MSTSIYNPQVLTQLTAQETGDRVLASLIVEGTGKSYPMLINPESLQWSRSATFSKQQTAGTSVQSQQFYNTEGRTLKLSDIKLETYRAGKTLSQYLEGFEALLQPQATDERWHSPKPLTFVWGSRQFGPCILKSMSWDEKAWISGEPATVKFSLSLEEIPPPDTELQRRLPPNTNADADALDTPLTERQRAEGSGAAQTWLQENAVELDDDLRDRVAANRYLLTTDEATGNTTITDENGEALGIVGQWNGREFTTDEVQDL